MAGRPVRKSTLTAELLGESGTEWLREPVVVPPPAVPEKPVAPGTVDPSHPRERIIRGTAAIIARDGYGNSRIADIAKESRVSLRTFYAEFETKEAVFLELHRRVVDSITSAVTDSIDFDKPWRQVMYDGFYRYFELLKTSPRFTTAMVFELVTLSEASREAREYARGEFDRFLIELVERGREANPGIPSRSLTPLLARSMLGGVVEVVTSELVDGQRWEIDALAETATDILWSVVTNVETGATKS